MNEAMAATTGSNALVLDTGELYREESLNALVMANRLDVKDGNSLALAESFMKKARSMKRNIEAYWKPKKQEIDKQKRELLASEKEALGPIEKAINTVQGKVNAYADEVRRKQMAEQEERRRLAQAAMDQKLAEAAEAESKGDAAGADMAMAEAEVYDGIAATEVLPSTRLNGMAQRVGWEIVSMIPEMVPINICGQIVHTSNKAVVASLVNKAIEQSGGKIQIPGVEYKEIMKVSVR